MEIIINVNILEWVELQAAIRVCLAQERECSPTATPGLVSLSQSSCSYFRGCLGQREDDDEEQNKWRHCLYPQYVFQHGFRDNGRCGFTFLFLLMFCNLKKIEYVEL